MKWIGQPLAEISPFEIFRNVRLVVGRRSVLNIYLLVRERSALATLIFTSRVCLSVIRSVIRSVCLSSTSELNISETRPDSGMVTMDGLYKLAYGLSIGHTPDDVT